MFQPLETFPWYRRIKITFAWKVVCFMFKRTPQYNCNLHWDNRFLAALKIKDVAGLPLEFTAQFADDICRAMVYCEKVKLDDIPANTHLSLINITAVGNAAFIALYSPNPQIQDAFKDWLNHIAYLLKNGQNMASR